jgi:hypothetical protein
VQKYGVSIVLAKFRKFFDKSTSNIDFFASFLSQVKKDVGDWGQSPQLNLKQNTINLWQFKSSKTKKTASFLRRLF